MTSLGHKRTGQTEKGADSAPPLPTLPPSCPQLTQTSAICLSVQAAKNQIKTKLSPALKIHRSDWIWGSSEANTPAAKWHHCSEHTNKIINIHRKKAGPIKSMQVLSCVNLMTQVDIWALVFFIFLGWLTHSLAANPEINFCRPRDSKARCDE